MQSIRELDHPGNSWNPSELMNGSKRDDDPKRYSSSGNKPRIEANETNDLQNNDQYKRMNNVGPKAVNSSISQPLAEAIFVALEPQQ